MPSLSEEDRFYFIPKSKDGPLERHHAEFPDPIILRYTALQSGSMSLSIAFKSVVKLLIKPQATQCNAS